MKVDTEMRPPDNNFRLLQLNFCWYPPSFLVRVLLMLLVSTVMSVVVYNKVLVPAITGGYSSSSWSDPPQNKTIWLYNETFDDQLGSQKQAPPTTTYIISSNGSASDSMLANETILLDQEQSIWNSVIESEDHEAAVDASKAQGQKQVPTTTSQIEANDTISSNQKADEHTVAEASKTTQIGVVRRYSKLEKLEAGLARARSSIREAALVKNMTSTHQDPDYVPRGPIYINANAFHRSYLEMEKLFKIYVYKEGELPLFHEAPCKNIYTSEGSLFRDLEFYNIYRTQDSNEAMVFFLPISVAELVHYLYVPGDFKIPDIRRTVVDYINIISTKYPFWNRSLGADHFMLACHDWGPAASKFVPNLLHKSIRVLCNANTSEGFDPSKDVTLAGIYLRTGKRSGLVGGLSPSRRSILAFFAGGEHGHIRTLLFKNWKDKDQDIQVHEYLPKGVSYTSMIRRSKFCLCPSGYEVGSPRIVEAIYGECVPVIIKEGYVPPFSDVLNWNKFSVKLQVKDIPNLKNILMGISQRQYLRLQRRVKQVQRHFVVNPTPKRFDIFHMTVHSIWLRRLNVQIKDFDYQSHDTRFD